MGEKQWCEACGADGKVVLCVNCHDGYVHNVDLVLNMSRILTRGNKRG